jgi:hypothetical protein
MAEPERIPRVHVLEIPVVWFLLQLVEYGVLIPDPEDRRP